MGCGRSWLADQEEEKRHSTKVELSIAQIEELFELMGTFYSQPLTRGAHGNVDRIRDMLSPIISKYYEEQQ